MSAQVFLCDGTGAWLDATFTDTNGNFSFDGLSPAVTMSTDGNDFPILNFMDANPPAQTAEGPF